MHSLITLSGLCQKDSPQNYLTDLKIYDQNTVRTPFNVLWEASDSNTELRTILKKKKGGVKLSLQQAMKAHEVVSLRSRLLFNPRKIPGIHFC
jgi:hypothetical protein